MTKEPKQLRIAVDTGGTFTDCVWVERGRLRMTKVFSTPDDPSRAIAEAVKQVTGGANAAVTLLHGTTVGTNALLQRKGARVAFVTTEGFEDSIQIGRQARPKLYDFFFDAIEPLVPGALRFGVPERTDKNGTVLRFPLPSELSDLVHKLRAANPEAIALSLLFSFADPHNEQLVAKELEKIGVPLSVSHQILPEFREYERASTVVVNAYLQPLMSSYLEKLRRGISGRTFVMQSSGGLASLETASREPVRTVLSGPAGGVVGAAAMARRSGYVRVIGFDMGGTSTDVCLVDGAPTTTNEADVDGLPVRVPMLNIHTVGAGGGSLARFDAGGALRVGPESAGADPGPICYGKGTQPTVTDCNLLLGRLPADKFLGGSFALDLARTRKLTQQWLNHQPVKMSLEQFAEGVIRVVNATMEKAIRVVSLEKGYDPRDFTLVAFGGAGALHACEMAESLGIPRVLVPYMPGALSAVGILISDVAKDYSRTLVVEAKEALPLKLLQSEMKKLSDRADQEFTSEGWRGKPLKQQSLDLRYKGQGFELNVPFGEKSLKLFHAEHKRRYGYSREGHPVEIVTVRLRASIKADSVALHADRPKSGKAETTRATFAGSARLTSLIARSNLASARRGPAIVTEYSATTVVPPGWTCAPDKQGNLVLRRSGQKKSDSRSRR